jgi:hypothetical protein
MNIQHPTSNTEQPVFHPPPVALHWMLVVGCSVLGVSHFLLETTVSTLIPKIA